MKLTIVICTHNRCNLLSNAIDSITAAVIPDGFDINILVIANACADGTIEMLEKRHLNQRQIHLNFLKEPQAGKSYALNHAIRYIESGYLCFIDDDQRVDNNYFFAIEQALNTYPKATMLCGPLFPDWQGDEPFWIHESGNYRIYPLPIPVFNLGNFPLIVNQENQLPPGGHLIAHCNVFKRIGLFNEKLGPTGHNLIGSEDSEFLLRALNQGEVLYYIPNLIQYHYVDKKRLKLSYLIKMSFERNKSFTKIKLQKKQKIPNYLWRKLFDYAINAFFSFDSVKIRYFLMRIASTLGEIFAYKEK